MTCRHGVEAGAYCAKCGREIVTGPVVSSNVRSDSPIKPDKAGKAASAACQVLPDARRAVAVPA